MARANWKGFLHLSLVTCPVALFSATSDSDKIRFDQINKNAGHRIKYAKVDAETGEKVERPRPVASIACFASLAITLNRYASIKRKRLERQPEAD